jgi:hypothetical protein
MSSVDWFLDSLVFGSFDCLRRVSVMISYSVSFGVSCNDMLSGRVYGLMEITHHLIVIVD